MSDSAPKSAEFDLVIEAGHTSAQYWRDLWRYRELFYFLAWRDVLVRYKQTTLGIAWAILQPVATMIVGTIIFGRLAKLPDGGVPYPILIYVGMLPWQFFSSALTNAGQSVLSNAQLITKVYFPRLIVPAAAVITSFIDFCIAGVVLVGLMIWYQFWPDWRVLALPALHRHGLRHRARRRLVDHRAECEVPRLSLRRAISRSVWHVSLACVFQQRVGAGALSFLVRLESDGGRDRRIPLGAAWRKIRTRSRQLLAIRRVGVRLLVSGIWYFRRTERAFADLV